MSSRFLRRLERLLFVTVLCLALNSCVGTAVGVAVDTSIEVAKAPFKLVGAAADLAIPDDDDD
jgi:hypothetical protein